MHAVLNILSAGMPLQRTVLNILAYSVDTMRRHARMLLLIQRYGETTLRDFIFIECNGLNAARLFVLFTSIQT